MHLFPYLTSEVDNILASLETLHEQVSRFSANFHLAFLAT